jgi:hypothetical protein
MHVIKIILIVVVLGLVVWAFRNRNRVGIRAGARLIGLVLAVFAIASIIDTGIPQALADHVGVTRGTDLILYTLVLVFVMTSVGLYFRAREIERRLATLVRVSAIRDAVLVDGLPGADNDAAGADVAH